MNINIQFCPQCEFVNFEEFVSDKECTCTQGNAGISYKLSFTPEEYKRYKPFMLSMGFFNFIKSLPVPDSEKTEEALKAEWEKEIGITNE